MGNSTTENSEKGNSTENSTENSKRSNFKERPSLKDLLGDKLPFKVGMGTQTYSSTETFALDFSTETIMMAIPNLTSGQDLLDQEVWKDATGPLVVGLIASWTWNEIGRAHV